MTETVVVFGGTGFLGSAIVDALRRDGRAVRIASRRPPAPEPEPPPLEGAARISHAAADVQDEHSAARAIAGASAVVNAVSLYVERRGATFESVHVDGARRLARLAREAGAECIVHISGLGTDPQSPSKFVRARARGEQAVRAAFASSVVMRPSVMCGPDGGFLARIEEATRWPVVPLFGNGATRLQPVHVRDVAAAVAAAVRSGSAGGRVFELGGAEVASYRRIVEKVMAHLGRRGRLLPVPFVVWETMTGALQWLPSPPLTRDQVLLMKRDNVVGPGAATFSALNIEPAGLSSMLAECLPRP